MAARSSRFEIPFRLLKVGRWDHAFDVAWNATARLSRTDQIAYGHDNQRAHALSVRNSRNHALGRNFSNRVAAEMVSAKQPGLEIAWQMLAADPDKPETIMKFAPQLAYGMKLEGAEFFDAYELADMNQRLAHWLDASEGRFRGASYSMFTLQLSNRASDRPEWIDALPNYQVAKIAPPIPDLEEPPGLVVMPAATSSKLHAEQTQFKDLVDRHLPFSIVPDLTPVRYKLLAQYPHAVEAIDLLLRDLRQDKPARINPVILVGPPGSGKSRLVRMFADAAGLGIFRFDASGISDSIAFSGTAKGWGHTQASVPARAILQTDIPNPVVMIDEIDKAGSGAHNGNFHNSLLPFLERETAARHRDVSLDAEMNMSWISYIATANDDSALPAFIKDRFRVIRLKAPTLEHLPALAWNVQADMAREAGEDVEWIQPLEPDELEVAGAAWAKAKFSMRALQKIVSATVEARSAFAMRH
jgi:ATP-dependent Lon protease